MRLENCWALCTFGLALLAGCDSEPPDPMRSPGPASVREYVTSNVLQQLDGSGRFRLAEPRAPDDIPIISPERARALAEAFMKTWGESYAPVWERERGAPVPWATLKLSPRVFFAATPHGRFPDGFHGAYRRMFGPQYLLFFDSGDEHVLGVSVAAYSGDLQIENGTIREPFEGGSYFTTHAVAPTGRWRYVPISPEEAVAMVNRKTGARATRVPELVLRAGWHPLLALWRIDLDRPVTLHRTGATSPGARTRQVQVREIYVGPGGVTFTPGETEVESISVAAEKHPFRPDEAPGKVDLQRRGSFPLRFDEVSMETEAS